MPHQHIASTTVLSINTAPAGSEANGLNFHTGVLFCFVFQALHITFQCQLCIFVSALGAKLFLGDSTASKKALFAQPQLLDFGKQSDPFDVLAKHYPSEDCTKKQYGNPTTLGRSKYCGVFSTKCLYVEEQADTGLILGMLKAEILIYILSI